MDKSDYICSLKLKIKKWEKKFYLAHDRKPKREDIERDDDIRRAYKQYWLASKRATSRHSASNSSSKPCQKENSVNVWGKEFNKKPLQEASNTVNITTSGATKRFSDKLLLSFLNGSKNKEDDTLDKPNFSLKRKRKARDSCVNAGQKENTFVINPENIEVQDSCPLPVLNPELDARSNFNIEQEIVDTHSDHVVVMGAVEDNSEPRMSSENKYTSNAFEFSSCEPSSSNPSFIPEETVDTIFSTMTFGTEESNEDNCMFDGDSSPFKADINVNELLRSTELTRISPIPFDLDFVEVLPEKPIKRRKKLATAVKKPEATNPATSVDSRDLFDHLANSFSSQILRDAISPSPEKTSKKAKRKSTKAKASKLSDNFKRLNMKKKCYAPRGKNKVNFRRQKWSQYKKRSNQHCFKCGDPNHWAQVCPMQDLKDDMFDEELHELGIATGSAVASIKARPLTDADLNLTEAIQDALLSLGHKTFRANQERTIQRIISGQSTLLIAATGSGKSLCYQLPAYLFWKYRKYITLVISPLVSLMEDQLTTLPKCLRAVALHSGLKPSQREQNLMLIRNGQAQIILMSPEMLTCSSGPYQLATLPTIGFVCIDEAHCISEWSHNFRPSYLQIFKVLRDVLKIETFLALTATATRETTAQIAKNLGLTDGDVLGETRIPDNLLLSVSCDDNKQDALIDLLMSDRLRNLRSIIIYCTRREMTEKLATFLRVGILNRSSLAKESDWSVQCYHAGLSMQERSRIQRDFISGKLRVVIATIAFGMGINKSNVQAVIHYNLPRSYESYVQEIGRAGRNGFAAYCHLFLDSSLTDFFELQRHVYANSVDKLSVRKLLEKVFKPCKCRQLKELGEDQAHAIGPRCCPGHETSFSVKETRMELNISEETIQTLLCFLELNYTKCRIEVLPLVNATCKLLSYGNGSSQMEEVSKACPIIALGLLLHKQRNKCAETPSMISFSYVEVASMLGKESSIVRKELRQSEWKQENNKYVRTNVRVEFSDPSFHVKAPGDLTEEEFEEVVEFLYKFTVFQQVKEIARLRKIYSGFKECSQGKATKNINLTKSNKLKTTLNEYFSNTDCEAPTQLKFEDFLNSGSSDYSGISGSITDPIFDELQSSSICDMEFVRSDVRLFVATYNDQRFTGRAIAKIFQGIGSPRYPAEIWGKVRRFWRSYVNMDFNVLMNLANEELVRFKTS